jgi:hypothetical protein
MNTSLQSEEIKHAIKIEACVIAKFFRLSSVHK